MPRRPSPTAVLLLFLAALWCPTPASASESQGRVIVLGFDGADARTAEEMMARGELPNLAKLRDQGTFAPLGTTMPAESPVSWASLNSGQNPAKTGVPGFVRRELGPSGRPQPEIGFYEQVTRKVEDLELPPVLALFSARSQGTTALGAGAVVFVLFLVLLAVLLRVRKVVALVLALLLGGLGGWAGWVASGYVPREISDIVANRTQVGGFWEPAARAGVPCVVIDGAMSWDRPPVEGAKVLAGLGVPDARGAYGDWFVYTTDEKELSRAPQGRATSTGGRVFRADLVEGRIESRVFGPKNFWAVGRLTEERKRIEEALAAPGLGDAEATRLRARREEIDGRELPALEARDGEEGRLSLPLVAERSGDPARFKIRIGDAEQELGLGEWSRWYHLRFDLNALLKVQAITRVHLEKIEPFRLFVDFLQLDPSAPPFWQPISQPPSFSRELAEAIDEPYETVGWACLTMPLKDKELDPAEFLREIEFTSRLRAKMLAAALERDDWRMLMFVEGTPDRVQHMTYQFYDPGHPLHDAEKAARKLEFYGEEIALSEAIPAAYREMDRVVGMVVDRHLRPEDTLIVCADHGFQSFRRQVHLNNWLAENGYLSLAAGVTRARGNALLFVDWSKTRAYALGLGGIYLNLEGREGQGIVTAAEAPALVEELRAKLLATTDPDSGARVVREVYRVDAIHSGPHLDLESDLIVGFDAGYRVGWSTTSGGIRLVQTEDKSSWIPGASIEDNRNNWSGDHVSVAEDLVRGVFFSNRKVAVPEGGLNLLDIAPTALALLGVPIPPEYDRPALGFER